MGECFSHFCIPSHPARTESSNDKTFPADESLFLVEIPPSAPALDGANIVGVGDNAQAALVFSDRSFLMSKVESSNTFVVVPPATADDENVPENSSGGAKRVKVSALQAKQQPSMRLQLYCAPVQLFLTHPPTTLALFPPVEREHLSVVPLRVDPSLPRLLTVISDPLLLHLPGLR